MSDTTVARRYARALYEEAAAQSAVERVDSDISVLQETLAGSRELQRLFASPVISRAKKKAVVKSLFESKIDALVVRLMQLLIEKGRESILPDVVRSYDDLRNERLGQIDAHVRTALPLGQQEQAKLQSALEQATGKSIVLNITDDPSLITGMVVRVGDVVYDGSGQHHLKMLREQFAARTYLSN